MHISSIFSPSIALHCTNNCATRDSKDQDTENDKYPQKITIPFAYVIEGEHTIAVHDYRVNLSTFVRVFQRDEQSGLNGRGFS